MGLSRGRELRLDAPSQWFTIGPPFFFDPGGDIAHATALFAWRFRSALWRLCSLAPTGASAQSVTVDASRAPVPRRLVRDDGPPELGLAFWGNTLVQGDSRGIRVFDISNPAAPALLSDFACNGAWGDVTIWGNLVFRSVDRPQDSASLRQRATRRRR